MSQDAPGWISALARLDEMLRAAEGLAVVRAADRAGLLEALVVPVRPEALAQRTGAAVGRVEAVLGVLEAHGVVERVEGGWRLTSLWVSLVEGSLVPLGPYLGWTRVRLSQLEASLDGDVDYWQLDEADRLDVARGVSFEPSAPEAQAMVREGLASFPEVVEALDAGGRVLELGCGVASRLTAMLLAFPKATAVGVELTPDLAAWGRARAERLGVGERLTYVVGDASSYRPEGAFDLVNWSQFFFPEPTRAGALAVAFEALRPGGLVSMPVVWDGTPHPSGSTAAQELAAERLALDLWGVPLRTTAEVADELEAAGFGDVQVEETPVVHFVRGRRP
jgi:SAM-dependent methyltransferase